jgi:hypothetical protein
MLMKSTARRPPFGDTLPPNAKTGRRRLRGSKQRSFLRPLGRRRLIVPQEHQGTDDALDQLRKRFEGELHAGAATRSRVIKRARVDPKDIKAEYRSRLTSWLREHYGEVTYAGVAFGFAFPPFLPPLTPVAAATAVNVAGAMVAACGLKTAMAKLVNRSQNRQNPSNRGRRMRRLADKAVVGPLGERAALELRRCANRLERHLREPARVAAEGKTGTALQAAVEQAWNARLVPLATASAPAEVALPNRTTSRAANWTTMSVALILIAVVLYLAFTLLPKLIVAPPWSSVTVLAAASIVYLVPRFAIPRLSDAREFAHRMAIWLISHLPDLRRQQHKEASPRPPETLSAGPRELDADGIATAPRILPRSVEQHLAEQRSSEQPSVEPPQTDAQIALQAGWTMAVLYGRIPRPPSASSRTLPTSAELMPAERRMLELYRLAHLLHELASVLGLKSSDLPTASLGDIQDTASFRAALRALNLAILAALAMSAQPQIQLAYELGRSLRDTANPPVDEEVSDPEALASQLARGRIAVLQQHLTVLSAVFPPHAAAAVAISLGHWSDLAMVTVNPATSQLRKGAINSTETAMFKSLLEQGDLWLMLLAGTLSHPESISQEGFTVSTAAALRRSGVILRQTIRHYWAALLLSTIIGAAGLYLAFSDLRGPARVWTAIAVTAGCIAAPTWTIASVKSRLERTAYKPVSATSADDAIGWAITNLPPVRLTARGVRHLRRAGTIPPSGLIRS